MEVTRAVSVHDSAIVKKLIEAKIIPPQCRRWELRAEANHVFEMISEVLVTPEQLEIIVRIINEHPEEAQAVARTVFKAMENDTNADLISVGEEWARKPRPRKVVE